MSESVTLAVDACGGDFAPSAVLDGVEAALDADRDLDIVLCGPRAVVEEFSSSHRGCTPAFAEEIIAMDEHPAEAVKTKRNSSIVIGCRLVRDGEAQGFFSAGSTGACLVAATLEIGRARGVKRPALGIVIPAYRKPTLLLDVGANADCKVEYLPQFAQMGIAYMSSVLGVKNPSVGLLNIGEEPTKGSSFAQRAYQLLDETVAEFSGNCEGGALMQGDFDVVVTDGFTGNVTLKSIEGTSKLIMKSLKDTLMASVSGKLGAALSKKSLMQLRHRLSPDSYGGSPLLGLKGVCMVGHGSSNAHAIKNGILAGAREARGHLPQMISAAIAEEAAKRADRISEVGESVESG